MPKHDTPILTFDVDVILTTDSHFLFMSQVNAHPGVSVLWENYLDTPGLCEHQDHLRVGFQHTLTKVFFRRGGTPRMIEFFNRCLCFEGKTPTDGEVNRVLAQMDKERAPDKIEELPIADKGEDDAVMDLVKKMFPGMEIRRIL